MSNEKPVELTEAEREGPIDAIQDGTEAAYVEDIIARAAREAAARREAEDDPKHARMYRALLERAEKAERAVADARREALLEHGQSASKSMDATMGMWQEQYARAERAEAKVARVEALVEDFRKAGFTGVYESAIEIAELIDRALAEPERDEEPCSDLARVDHAADHYAMTGRDNYRCERDEEGR